MYENVRKLFPRSSDQSIPTLKEQLIFKTVLISLHLEPFLNVWTR